MSLIQQDRYWEIQEFMENKQMPNEITKTTTTTQIAKTVNHIAHIDKTDDSDLILPSALVLQKTSKLVDQNKGQPGDIIEATNYTMLAKKGESIEIIPVYTYFDWGKYQKNPQDASKWDFISRMAMPEIQPERGKWSVMQGDIKYTKSVHMFCALTRDLDGVPVRFTFKGMSAGSGKKVSSHFQMSNRLSKSPCRFTFKISTVLATFNNNTSYAIEFSPGGTATKAQEEKAKMWRETFSGSKVAVSPDPLTETDDVVTEEVPF